MHGRSWQLFIFLPLLNATVDSMGGVVDSGVGVDTKTSPRCAAIEKAQAELRYVESNSICCNSLMQTVKFLNV